MKSVFILAFVLFYVLLSAADLSNPTAEVTLSDGSVLLSESNGAGLRTTNTWTGATSVAWETATNWSLESVPGSAVDVVIPVVSNNRYPVVYNSSDAAQSVTVQTGAMITIFQGTLTVTTSFTSYGTLAMASTSGSLVVQGNVFFRSGASTNITVNAPIKVQGNVTFDTGSGVNMANGTLRLYGSANSYISTLATTTIKNLESQKTSPYAAVFAADSNSSLSITSLIRVYSGSTLLHEDTGTIVLYGNLTVDPGGAFQFANGFFSFAGNNNSTINLNNTDSYFYYLAINKGSSSTVYLNSDISLHGTLGIMSGILDSGSHTISLRGNWFNMVGITAFIPGSGTVIFDIGLDYLPVQYVDGITTFYNVTSDSDIVSQLSFQGMTRISGTLDVNCLVGFVGGADLGTVINDAAELSFYNLFNYNIASYTGSGLLSGSLSVSDSCHVIIADLAQDGIYGNIIVDNSHLEIHQDAASYINLNGSVTISENGIMDIYGGVDNCRIANNSACTFTMSSGEFNVKNQGILILNSAYACDFNVTGGAIRCNGMWYDARGNFDPTGGTVEMDGSADSSITVFGASWFYNLSVNKASIEPSEPSRYLESNSTITRSGDLYISACSIKGGLTIQAANAVYLLGTVNVLNAAPVIVNAGILDLNGYILATTGNVNVSGILKLTASSSLQMASTKNLSILNGGTLLALGTSTTPATITQNASGYYALNVENGGSIGASYAIFEYMDINGVNIEAGAHVDDTYSLNNCTFRNGEANGRLLLINNGQSFIVSDAIFPANTWGGLYNVSKTTDIGIVCFSGWSGDFGGLTYEQDPYNHIYWQGIDIHSSYIAATNSIQLNWTYPLTATSYNIYRCTDPYGTFSYYANTSYTTWSEIVPGTRYYYRVTAVVP